VIAHERAHEELSPSNCSAKPDYLLRLFAIIYALDAFCEPRGVIGQPLMRYGKETLEWSPTELSLWLTLLGLPWLLKPIFGLVSDVVPFLGSRRRNYLVVANLSAAATFAILSLWSLHDTFIPALLTIGGAMAMSSAVCGGLLVESGQKTDRSALLVNQQWLSVSAASIAATAIGGFLVERYPSEMAVRVSAAGLMFCPLIIVVAAVAWLNEPPAHFSRKSISAASSSLWASLRGGQFLAVALFLFFYMFSPGIYVALYYKMTDSLHFSPSFIGILSSIAAGGSILGVLLHRLLLRFLTVRSMVYGVLGLSVASTLSYLVFNGPIAAVIIKVTSGLVGGLTIVVAATLAAEFCPLGTEAFGYAVLAAIENLAIHLSDLSGSYLYTSYFDRRLAPLVVISAATTAVALLFVPFLRLGRSVQNG
jgi:MFS family permease